MYDILVNSVRCTQTHPAPVFDCCFSDEQHIYSGGLAKEVRCLEVPTQTDTIVGYHDAAVRTVHYVKEQQWLITGSWDSTLRVWDPRNPTGTPLHTLNQPGYVYTMDTAQWWMVVGTAQRKIALWDLRNLGQPVTVRDSSLKYQTRCIRCFPNGQGYVVASIEGRIGVEFFDMSAEVQKRKYAFKCHRERVDDVENIYPVNAIAFHNAYNTFASGSSDGFVNVWDAFNQKRLDQLPRFDMPVTSLAFSQDGFCLAIGIADMNESDSINASVAPKEGNIFIRYMADHEVRPKTMPPFGSPANTTSAH